MRVAIEGCGHGTLHAIYASIQKTCEIQSWNGVDLVIIGGDFQAVRNSFDLNTMSVPHKFRAIGDFHEYYSGKRTAPYLTLFVGGNHEASSHLQELYYGGWVAPKIYYLGAANVLRVGNLRIAGLSGIWKGYNYQKPHFERLPYTADEIKSLYHVREIDVRKLLLLREQVDVGLSHDWPRSIEWLGDHKALFRKKDLFEADAKAGTLGSAAAKYVMDRLRPPYWFAAHLHCKFAAVVDYAEQASNVAVAQELTSNGLQESKVSKEDEINLDLEDDGPEKKQRIQGPVSEPVKNKDEIDLDMDEDSSEEPQTTTVTPHTSTISNTTTNTTNQSIVPADLRAQLPASFTRSPRPKSPPPPTPLPPPPRITNTKTSFLALDKCLPNRKFLQLLDIAPLNPSASSPSPSESEEPTFTYDPEWLSILRVFASHDPHTQPPRNEGEAAYIPLIAQERQWVDENIVAKNRLTIPENFELTGPVYDGRDIRSVGTEQPREYTNPQTTLFCDLLGVRNWFHEEEERREERKARKEKLIRMEMEEGGGRRGGGGRGSGGRGGRGGGGGGRGRGRGWR